MIHVTLALVVALGSPTYETRRDSERLLRAFYPASAPAILLGTRSRDPETSRTCRRLRDYLVARDCYRASALYLLLRSESLGYYGPDLDWAERTTEDYRIGVVHALRYITGYVPMYDGTTPHEFLFDVNTYRYQIRHIRLPKE